MRRAVIALSTIALLFAGCSSDGTDVTTGQSSTTVNSPTSSAPPSSLAPPTTIVDGESAATAQILAAAIHQLVTVDHTFGAGPPPFDTFLVLDHLDPDAGIDGKPGDTRPLTETERNAITAAIEEFGPVQFVADRDDHIDEQNLAPKIPGSVILGVGAPDIDDDRALVSFSMWCGGLCGLWGTYIVEPDDDTWTVTGTEGGVAIS